MQEGVVAAVSSSIYKSTDDSLSGDRSSSGPTVATLEADDFPGLLDSYWFDTVSSSSFGAEELQHAARAEFC
jgi:hypothetical protein